jgi:hypothetical protein
VQAGSVLVFSGEARWRWRHGIGRALTDEPSPNGPDPDPMICVGPRPHSHQGQAVAGGRRTSITLRQVANDSKLAEAWGMNGLRFCNLPPLEKNAGRETGGRTKQRTV